jgi:hypothetical protein
VLVLSATSANADNIMKIEPWLKLSKNVYNDIGEMLSQITLLHVVIVWIISHLVLFLFYLIISYRTYRKRRKKEEEITLRKVIVDKYPLNFVYTLVADA